MQKVFALLKSRKFWALVVAIVTSVSLLATDQVDQWQFLQAVVAALAAFSTGVAIEDAGMRINSR